MDRSQLRIADLKQRAPNLSIMMNVKVPEQLFAAITALAKQLRTTKTEVAVALFNAGLERTVKLRGTIGHQKK